MNEPNTRRAVEPIRCGGCGNTWTANGAAHCSGCHNTFSTAGHFDTHRTAYGERGQCNDPATLTNKSGDRVLHLRDGMWRGPEMTDAEKAARFGDKAPVA